MGRQTVDSAVNKHYLAVLVEGRVIFTSSDHATARGDYHSARFACGFYLGMLNFAKSILTLGLDYLGGRPGCSGAYQ